MSQAARRATYLATLDADIIKTFKRRARDLSLKE
jgi:hypothetical protein